MVLLLLLEYFIYLFFAITAFVTPHIYTILQFELKSIKNAIFVSSNQSKLRPKADNNKNNNYLLEKNKINGGTFIELALYYMTRICL